MAENRQLTRDEMLQIVSDNIAKMENKSFNVYFFVIDTKGNPSGSLEYIYQTALTLKELGYNVTMIHNEKDFVGVGDWLGPEFAELPHKNVEDNNIEISACDFLFIPEIYSNVMIQTKTTPCKRVMILQNYNFLVEAMPVGTSPINFGITDVVTTTDNLAKKASEFFEGVRTHVVHPSVQPAFRPKEGPKKLVVNIVSRDQSDINSIIKPFYWKYPLYKWVSFRDLRGVTQDVFAEALREAFLTIWVDTKTDFGYSAIEALKCGSIVLGKVPDRLSDWNVTKTTEDEASLTRSIIWFDDFTTVPDMVASIVRTWTMDEIPDEVYEDAKAFDDKFTLAEQKEEIVETYEKGLFEKRLKEFKEVVENINNGTLKSKED